jgi:hypothetical protein
MLNKVLNDAVSDTTDADSSNLPANNYLNSNQYNSQINYLFVSNNFDNNHKRFNTKHQIFSHLTSGRKSQIILYLRRQVLYGQLLLNSTTIGR